MRSNPLGESETSRSGHTKLAEKWRSARCTLSTFDQNLPKKNRFSREGNYPSTSSLDLRTCKTLEMQRSSSSTCLTPLLILLTLLILQNGVFIKLAEGGKKKIHIPDELDDVVDDEEDEEWKKWGEKTKKDEFDPPKIDPNMDPLAFQAEMMKKHAGPSFGFVKLRFGAKRTPDMVAEIAMKWTRILKTGSIESRFMGVDLSTIMFTLVKGQDTTELMEFILSQPESYEIKIGDQTFRRPGDPPLDEVLEKRHSEEVAEGSSPVEEQEDSKDEL